MEWPWLLVWPPTQLIPSVVAWWWHLARQWNTRVPLIAPSRFWRMKASCPWWRVLELISSVVWLELVSWLVLTVCRLRALHDSWGSNVKFTDCKVRMASQLDLLHRIYYHYFLYKQYIIKQLLDSVYVISGIIKVSVSAINLSVRLRSDLGWLHLPRHW